MAPLSVHIRNRIIISKVTSALSMISSLLIMRDVDRKRRKGEIPLTFSLVFLMSCCDFFFSFFVTFLSSWMVPKETGAYLASGNQKTCTAQGFMYVFFLTSTVLTNASLAIAYCLKVRWTRINIYSHQKVLWALHLLPPFVGFCMAVAALFDKAYNFSGGGLCEVVPYPMECLSPDSDSECIRGLNTEKLKMALLSVAIAANLVIVASIILLVRSVFVQERKMESYNFRGTTPRRKNTSKAAWQGIWYIAAFELAYAPWYLWQIIFVSNHATNTTSDSSVVPGYVLVILFPTQGLWNLLVYLRPRYKFLRERYRSESRLTTMTRLFGSTRPPSRNIPSPYSGNGARNETDANNTNVDSQFPAIHPELENNRSDGLDGEFESQNSEEINDGVSATLRARRVSISARLMHFTFSMRGPAIILGEGNDSFESFEDVDDNSAPHFNTGLGADDNSSQILDNETGGDKRSTITSRGSISTVIQEQEVIVQV